MHLLLKKARRRRRRANTVVPTAFAPFGPLTLSALSVPFGAGGYSMRKAAGRGFPDYRWRPRERISYTTRWPSYRMPLMLACVLWVPKCLCATGRRLMPYTAPCHHHPQSPVHAEGGAPQYWQCHFHDSQARRSRRDEGGGILAEDAPGQRRERIALARILRGDAEGASIDMRVKHGVHRRGGGTSAGGGRSGGNWVAGRMEQLL